MSRDADTAPDAGGQALDWAYALIDGLVRAGAGRAVLSPGARSTPLTLACARHPGLSCRVIQDERAAGFFALGLARADGRPVLLVCTSGTAVANWHPAVMEADAACVPLVLLSADRPPEHLACGANQTTDQIKLFGGAVRAFHQLPPPDGSRETLPALAGRLVERALWPLPGPVHLNVPFREPLVPADPGRAPLPPVARPARVVPPRLSPDPAVVTELGGRLSGTRGAIICGGGRFSPDFAPAVAALARALGWPVLACPLSGLRRGGHDRSHILAGADGFLRAGRFCRDHRPDWLLRLGAVPVSKPLQQYLAAGAAQGQIVVEGSGRWPDPFANADLVVRAAPALFCAALAAAVAAPAPAGWFDGFRRAEARVAELLAGDDLPAEAAVVAALARLLPAGSRLFSGNSMPVRELDAFLGTDPRALEIVANRGVSGIDGGVATTLGLAAADPGRVVVALIGDLAFQHDLNGLLAARQAKAVFVVLNNGGGGIFEYLPQAGLPEFAPLWLTPAATTLAAAAGLFGIGHALVEQAAELEPALAAALAAPASVVVEVMVGRAASVARHRALWAALADPEHSSGTDGS